LRSRYCLLGFLILASSSPAFARGGPGGALGSALAILLVIAIVTGFVAGVVCARLLRRTPWKSLAFVFVVALTAAVALPFVGILFGIPVFVSLAVFACVFYVVRGGVFSARNGAVQGDDVNGTSDVWRWIAVTYAFWAVVAVANIELLGFLAVPPLVLVSPGAIARFLPFILPPLAAALVVGAVVTIFAVKRHPSSRHAAPLIFNACVLVSFFVSADVYRYHLMAQSLAGHAPVRLESSSFLTSVLEYRPYFRGRHAGFEENGKSYRWSYSEREFVQLPQSN
jgi:hypothetical protein